MGSVVTAVLDNDQRGTPIGKLPVAPVQGVYVVPGLAIGCNEAGSAASAEMNLVADCGQANRGQPSDGSDCESPMRRAVFPMSGTTTSSRPLAGLR